jgi:methyl-accepting chemotaxis protein
VEAANTGEQGKGFAVVAAEVRNLSKRSSKSANEIKSLVEENVSIVGDGAKIVDATINDIHDIVGDVKKVNEVISSLANSVKEQQEGIEHINTAIEKLNEVTRMNAWIAEETSSSTDILYEKSNKFLNLINFFQFAKK